MKDEEESNQDLEEELLQLSNRKFAIIQHHGNIHTCRVYEVKIK
jgi:hypothetical protein